MVTAMRSHRRRGITAANSDRQRRAGLARRGARQPRRPATDATEQVFHSPEDLYQEKEEVLKERYRSALAYYEEHLSKSS